VVIALAAARRRAAREPCPRAIDRIDEDGDAPGTRHRRVADVRHDNGDCRGRVLGGEGADRTFPRPICTR
jgi:hypothetical protein